MNEFRQLMIGSMLGDGHITKCSLPHKPRLQIAHGVKQKKYLEHKWNILHGYKLAGKISHYKRNDERYKSGYIEEYRFKSKTHPIFSTYRNLFYPNNVSHKQVNEKMVLHMEPQGLAIWLLDDMHKVPYGYQINTQSFSKENVQFLRKLLWAKFNIDTTYQKFDNIIYIRSKSVNLTDSLILPFTPECMKYKLHQRVLNKSDEFSESPGKDNTEPS